jgi:hypothetical protein
VPLPPQDAPPGPRGLSAKADVGDGGVPAPLPKLRSGAPAAETARGAAGARPGADKPAATTPKTPRSAAPATSGDEGELADDSAPSAKARGKTAKGTNCEKTDEAENAEAGEGEKDGKGKGRWPRLRGRRTAVIR